MKLHRQDWRIHTSLFLAGCFLGGFILFAYSHVVERRRAWVCSRVVNTSIIGASFSNRTTGFIEVKGRGEPLQFRSGGMQFDFFLGAQDQLLVSFDSSRVGYQVIEVHTSVYNCLKEHFEDLGEGEKGAIVHLPLCR